MRGARFECYSKLFRRSVGPPAVRNQLDEFRAGRAGARRARTRRKSESSWLSEARGHVAPPPPILVRVTYAGARLSQPMITGLGACHARGACRCSRYFSVGEPQHRGAPGRTLAKRGHGRRGAAALAKGHYWSSRCAPPFARGARAVHLSLRIATVVAKTTLDLVVV